QQQGWAPPPRDPARKSLIGALFDLNFDHMVTAKVAKIVYAASLVPITLVSLLLVGYGLDWMERDAALLGFAMLVTAPFLWLIQLLAIRILMEFVINQFKISEYLRVIKDKK
ncbi:DUF4282 domain-containing protein, partial [Actinomadura sp. 7K507]|uniref:DUF4282 domain-containing protein n=1 Tax=Actinomadura sp. 7K507 TaxID=2530365 RepID=UPI001050671E